jgi:hypothetical protein|tara:strand:- start:1527 stop:2183 length:657 start_codon:yes stop_codon:yes gene_type:complete
MILSFFRDVILLDFNLPLWNIALNIGLIVILGVVALLSQLDKIPSERSQFFTLVCMLCVGAKPIATMILQTSPLPLYMAIVLFGSAVAFISYRYYYYIVGFTVVPWLIVALSIITTVQLISTAITLLLASGIGLYILKRRREAIIPLMELKHRVKSLESILPLCCNCKKTRDDHGNWKTVEEYLEDTNRNLQISHGICPECNELLYGDLGQVDKNCLA